MDLSCPGLYDLIVSKFKFEKLLENLSSAEIDSYVMTDSNINLLRFDNHPPAVSLIESAMENGFIQTVMKASRIFDGKI